LGKAARTLERDAFERLVAEALAGIPARFRAAIANLVIVVEDEPSPELLEEAGMDPGEAPPRAETLLGLYQGIPLTERGWDHGNRLPDRIVLFQGPLERASGNHDDLVAAVAETLIHEIGHYFGLSEAEIQAIEERYWRRRS
jgi:predicted Zn-dependent protease with MMP-like domain